MAEGIPGAVKGVVVDALFDGWRLAVEGIFTPEMALTEPLRGRFNIEFDFEVTKEHCQGWPPDHRAQVEVPYLEVFLREKRDEERTLGVGALARMAQVPASREWDGPTIIVSKPKR